MLPLQPAQEEIFKRVETKAQSMGLTRADQGWYWASSYQLLGHSSVHSSVHTGCNCDPNVLNSPVNIFLMVQLPSTGKYAKLETTSYTIEEFEKLNAEDFIKLSLHVQKQTNEIQELEMKLQLLRKDLTKYVKKAIKK